jgi:hypothetical protein
MSPTASSDRAAGLFGRILPTRTWLSGVGWAVTPRNGRRGNSCATAAETQRERKTKMQRVTARFPTMSFGEYIFRTPTFLPFTQGMRLSRNLQSVNLSAIGMRWQGVNRGPPRRVPMS